MSKRAAATTSPIPVDRRIPREADPEVAQRNRAILWVIHGALWFALMSYCWTAWVESGNFKPNTLGRGQEPEWYVILTRGWEILALLMTVVVLWVFVIRPKVRTGRFSFDGLFVLGCGLMFFQEPWINWTSYQYLYSTTSINFGSWLNFIPGWSSPNAQLMPVSLWAVAGYLCLVSVPAMGGSKFMTRLTLHNPGISKLKLIALTYVVFCVLDIIFESFATWTNLFSFASVIPSLTLFVGTDHQFPIYEMFSWAGTWMFLACVHFFRDDRGRSLPERGIDTLRLGERTQTLARFLAVVGICQLSILLTFNVPYQLYAQHADMSKAYLNQPWRLGGICGPGTNFDCPGPGVPIPRRDSHTNKTSP